jgi:hypothetical protein
VQVNTHGSSFDTLLAVYTGSSVSGLTQVAANDDDGSPNFTSGLTFTAQAGIEYQIAVDGFSGASGSIVLNWALGQFLLTVTLAGTGSGMVASSPVGINCGSTCSAGFAPGTSVTLTAMAAGGSTFAGWNGEGCSGTSTCTVSMTQARSVTATFNAQSSACLWGLWIDDHQSGGGWESRLIVANIDTQQTHNYEAFILAADTFLFKSFGLTPSGIAVFTCSDLHACGVTGWLYVQSDAPVFAASLFVINNIFGGGSFTAQTPLCLFGAP